MKEDKDELAAWAEDFRGGAGPALTPDAILAQASKDDRKDRLAWLAQIGSTLFAVAVFFGLVVRMRSTLMTGLAAVVVPTLLALFGHFVHERLSLSGVSARSVREHAGLAVRRRRAEVRLLVASRAALALLSVAFWGWLPLFAHANAERFGREPWRLVTGVVASLLVFGVAFWRIGRLLKRQRAELARWEAALSALDGDADRAP